MSTFDTKLTHKAFFETCLDGTFAGLEGIRESAAKEDWAACEQQFLIMLKNTLQPETMWKNYNNIHGNHYCQKSETSFDIAHRIEKDEFISVGIPHRFEQGVDYSHNPTPDGYKEWTWQLNRHHEWEELAVCYRETGDERYARTFRRLMTEFIRQMPAPGNVSGGETKGWRTIEIGIRLSHSWPLSAHTFLHSPSLSPRDWTVFFKSIYENAKRLEEHYTCGNWLLMEMNGLTHVALLFPFFKEAKHWQAFSMNLLLQQADVQIYDDGFQYELTTNYHGVVAGNYRAIAKLYQKCGVPVPEEMLALLEKLYGLYPKLATPHLTLPDLNDGARHDLTVVMKRVLELFPHRKDFAYIASNRTDGEKSDFDCIHLPNSGMAVFRSGWQADDLWCFFEAAPFGFGHQHEDKLNLLLYAFGKEMITEAGCNAYDGSVRHVYALSTQGHNGILVDGHSQCRRPHYRNDSIRLHDDAGLKYKDTPHFACAEGLFDETFGEDAKEVKHHRRVIYMKDPAYAQPYILVIDRLYGDGKKRTYDCLWHYTDHPYTLWENTVTVDFGDGVTLTTLTAGYDTVRVVRGQEEPFQGWLASTNVEARLPIPTAVLTKTADKDLRLITLLAPCKGTGCPISSLTAETDVENTVITLHTQTGEVTLNEADYFAV